MTEILLDENFDWNVHFSTCQDSHHASGASRWNFTFGHFVTPASLLRHFSRCSTAESTFGVIVRETPGFLSRAARASRSSDRAGLTTAVVLLTSVGFYVIPW